MYHTLTYGRLLYDLQSGIMRHFTIFDLFLQDLGEVMKWHSLHFMYGI